MDSANRKLPLGSPADLYDHLPLGVILAKPGHEIMFANREFFTLTECTAEDLSLMRLEDVLSMFFSDPGKLEEVSAPDGKWHSAERCIARKDGGSAWVRVHLSSIQGQEGEELLQLLVEDISKYRDLIDAMLSRQRHYRSIVERRPDPICRFLPDWSLIFANASYCRCFGRSRQDVLGESFLLLLPPEERRLFVEAVETITPEQPLAQVEHQAAWVEDRPLWIRWTVQGFFYSTGHIKDFQAVGADVTDQKIAEEHYMHADRLVSLGTLVSGVAHEVNNPNNFIMLNAPLAQDLWGRVAPILEDRIRDGYGQACAVPLEDILRDMPQLLSGIIEGSSRIRDIVRELKEFARHDDASSFRPLSVNDVVGSAVRLMRKTIDAATTRFSVRYGDGLPPVRGSHQRLEQVVLNLLQNSCNSLPDENRIIEVKTALAEPSVVLVTVRDGGVGIRAEDLPHITEPFFSTHRSKGGTGLGLSICQKIVREHGGRLRLESTKGGGTLAEVALPVYPEF